MTGQEARDDEREALACVLLGVRRIPLDPEWPRHADALAQADAILAAGFRKHPEPEWEFGEMNAMGGVWPIKPDISPELWASTPVERRRRRIAPGPWVPVGEGEQ